VITVKVPAKQDEETIVKNTFKLLTEPPFKFMDPLKSAPRVILWHRFFTLGRSPVVVLAAFERKLGLEYADLTGAVRTLVEDYKLPVIVDGSPNSLDKSLLRTNQRVIDIKPMTREMIWKLDQLQELFKYITEAGLDDAAFAVLGGIPSRYEELWDNTKTDLQKDDNTKTDLQKDEDARQANGTHLCAQIYAAIKAVEEFCGKDDTTVSKLMKLFRETAVLRESTLIANQIKRPTPDKVFREVERDGVPVLRMRLVSSSVTVSPRSHH
jgi:hypothetical protein